MKKDLSFSRMIWVAVLASLGAGLLRAAPPADGNGAAPRPFYVVAHNPNKVSDVEAALLAGANALEPDVTKAYVDPFHDSLPNDLPFLVDYDSSPPFRPGTLGDTHFVDWLRGVHGLALKYPNRLALITFDVKSSAAKAELGPIILKAIRENLNFGGVRIPFVLSVGKTNDGALFDNILRSLGPDEGVQVDGQNDPAGVLLYFASRGYMGNIAVGDGGVDAELPLVPNDYWIDMDRAAFLRAKTGNPKVIPYLYTFAQAANQMKIIDGGADGIIPDIFRVPGVENPAFDPSYLGVLAQRVAGRGDVRLATPLDNPFQPATEAYGIQVVTGSGGNAGTDAVLQFKLIGTLGSSSVLMDTSKTGRMEAGKVNFVTLPSKDLGELQWLEIRNNGDGNAPGWDIVSAAVFSARWLSPVSGGLFYTANSSATSQILNATIEANQTAGFRLVMQGGQPYRDAWANASTTFFPPDGSVVHPWPQFFSGYTYLREGGVLHLGPGNYPGMKRLDKRSRLVREPSLGNGIATLRFQ